MFGPLTAKTSAIVTELRAIEMHDVRASLEAATEDFSDAERMVRHGDVCASSRSFAHADEVISSALDAIDRQLADAVRGRAAVRTSAGTAGPAGDVTEADLLVVWLEYFREQVDGVRGLNRTGADAFAQVCGAATVDSVHGEIQSILDSKRRIVLTDGRTFGLAEPITVPGDISEGRAVRLTGLMFRDGNGYVSGVEPQGGGSAAPKATFVPCAKLRFAPVQRFPPVSSGPFVLHDPLGYNVEGTYKVEAGMGIAVQSVCPPDQSGKSFLRYSMKVEISYQQKGTSATVDHALMAAELTASDNPVLFSSDIDPEAPATLHVESDVRSCKQLKSLQCTDPTVIDTKDYPLVVRARGALAFALYDQVEFDVNDQLTGDFRFTHVSFFASIPGADDGTSPMFVAEGYGPFFDGISETVIVNDDPFAIRSTDFYPIFEPYTLAQSLQQLVAGWQSGVNHAAALGGRASRGSATATSDLQRVAAAHHADVVNFCDARRTCITASRSRTAITTGPRGRATIRSCRRRHRVSPIPAVTPTT